MVNQHPSSELRNILVNLVKAQANQMLVETGYHSKPKMDNVVQFIIKEKKDV